MRANVEPGRPTERRRHGKAVVPAVAVAVAVSLVLAGGMVPGRGHRGEARTEGTVSFGTYAARAEAAALSVQVVHSGFAPLFPVADIALARVSGSVDSRPAARAESAGADPGELIRGLPAFGVPVPAWPLYARAEYPGSPAEERASAVEQDVAGGTARALAGEARAGAGPAADAVAQVGGYEDDAVIAFGAAEAVATVRREAAAVVSRTEVTVEDLVIGGVLRIAALRVVAESRAGAEPGSAAADHRVETLGVRLAGQEVVIDEEGLRLPGETSPDGIPVDPPADPFAIVPLAGAARVLLDAQGITVSLALGDTAGEADLAGTAAGAAAGGLAVSVATPDGSVIEYRVGAAATQASAMLPLTFPAPEQSPPPPFPPARIDPVPPAPEEATSPAPPAAAAPPGPAATVLPAANLRVPHRLPLALALGQIGFWLLVGAAWVARPAPVARREWFFDVLDRVAHTPGEGSP